MKKILLIMFLLNSNCAISNDSTIIKKDYCIINDKYNEMGLMFEIKIDTIFLIYMNVIDNGNYINGYIDEKDYAGFFLLRSMKKNRITLKIKNYRYENDTCIVTLKFLDRGKKCIWEIADPKSVSYLPRKATFTVCSE